MRGRRTIHTLWKGVVLVGLLVAVPGGAGEPSALVQQVQLAYEQVDDLEGEFIQVTRIEGFQTTQTWRGHFYLKKPGRLRWDYTAPSRQQLYVNGETVWFYIPEHRQAIKTVLVRGLDTPVPYQLLAGTARLDEEFVIQVLAGDPPRLRLQPKAPRLAGPVFVVELDQKTALIQVITVEEANGNTSRFEFFDLRVNRGLPQDLFTFTVPPGVEVLELSSTRP